MIRCGPGSAERYAGRLRSASGAAREIHCAFMTVPLRFHDTSQFPVAMSAFWPPPVQASSAGLCCVTGHGAAAEFIFLRCRHCERHCRHRNLASACRRCPPCRRAGGHAADRIRFRCAGRFPAGVGDPEFPVDRIAAAAGAVGRAVADAGGHSGAAVAAQARRRADDRELRRPDGDRPRHRRVPVYDLSQSALVGDRSGPGHLALDVRAVVARSVPDSPPSRRRGRAGVSGGAGRICLHLAGRSLARLLRRRVSVEIRALRRYRGIGFRQLRLHGIRCRRRRAPESAAAGFLPSRGTASEHHHDPRRVELRHSPGRRRQGAAGLWRPFQFVRRQGAHVSRREQWRPELVHRIQRARRAVVALVRPVFLFHYPYCFRPGRTRPAAGVAPLRLQHHVAVSRIRRLHERAKLPDHDRHPALF